jgi:predicted nucleotidyltransferase component of viral defense system
MNLTEAQQNHLRVMRVVLTSVQDTPLVLKGGTALLVCYGLDRFSEDLDFDAPKKLNLESRMESALSRITSKLKITRTKDTDTVQRYRLEYEFGSILGRLKVEVSCRDAAAAANDVIDVAGVRTYRVSRLIEQKINAFENRTAARDLFDVHFLARRHAEAFSSHARERLRELTSDINRLEGRFRPAFEEDDLFRDQADIVPGLVLELHTAMT